MHVGQTARDVMTIQRADQDSSSWSFRAALARIAEEGNGVAVFICHNETTDEIEESIDWLLSGKQLRPKQDVAYKQIGTGSQILKDLGVSKMRVMSAPFKFNALSGFGLEVSEYLINE